MAKFTKAFSIIALVCAVIGFSGLGGPIVSGLFKALMGVTLIMLIIAALFGKELA